MTEFEHPLGLTSPRMKGKRVRDAQYTLEGHNRFHTNFHPGGVDGDYGLDTAHASDRARYQLGFADKYVKSGKFGQQLFDYLRTDGKHKRLPPLYLIRRKARLRQIAKSQTVKARALAIALKFVGTEESPQYSNRVMFSFWYGLIGPWCAMFLTYCYVLAGDKRVFARGRRSAWAYWTENMARQNLYGLRLTHDPEPGDIVVYHHGEGHTGMFIRWTDRARGHFQTVEGNTSITSDDNGGAVMIRDRYLGWVPTYFVSFPG